MRALPTRLPSGIHLYLGAVLGLLIISIPHPGSFPATNQPVAITQPQSAPFVELQITQPTGDYRLPYAVRISPPTTPTPPPFVAPKKGLIHKTVPQPTHAPRRPSGILPTVPLGHYSPGGVQAIIIAAAQAHGVSPLFMLKIARCESGFNPHALNPRGPYEGLFQFSPRTYASNGGINIWNPVEQSNIAAKMLAHGQAHQWSCA